MNGNRFFPRFLSLILTALMLLSACPASADAGNRVVAAGPNNPGTTVITHAECPSSSDGKHHWGKWKVTKKASCAEAGKKERKCSSCGKKEKKSVDKTEHSWGEWTVVTKPGRRTAGLRASVCTVCGETREEKLYPEGTLKIGDRGDRVRELQLELLKSGFDCGVIDGIYGKNTAAAVGKFQKLHGLTADGIAWPILWNRLGDKNVRPMFLPRKPEAAADLYTSGSLYICCVTDQNGECVDELPDAQPFKPGYSIIFGISLCWHWEDENGEPVKSDTPTLSQIKATHPLFTGGEGTPFVYTTDGASETLTTSMSRDASSSGWEIFRFRHTLTQAEIDSKKLVTQAEISWKDENGQPGSITTNTLATPLTAEGVKEMGSAEIVFTQTVLNEPQNGAFYQKGEPVMLRYDVCIDNIPSRDFGGCWLENLNVSSVQNGSRVLNREFSEGRNKNASVLFEHIITKGDVDRGLFSVHGEFSCVNTDLSERVVLSGATEEVQLPVGKGDGYTDGHLFMVPEDTDAYKDPPFYGKTVLHIPAGTLVELTGVTGNWAQILWNGKTCYIPLTTALMNEVRRCPICGESLYGRACCRNCGRCEYCDRHFIRYANLCSYCESNWEALTEQIAAMTEDVRWDSAETIPVSGGGYVYCIEFSESGAVTLSVGGNTKLSSTYTCAWSVKDGEIVFSCSLFDSPAVCTVTEDGKLNVVIDGAAFVLESVPLSELF